MSSLAITPYNQVKPQGEMARKVARIFYMMMTTDKEKPSIGKAMLLAGYAKKSADTMQKRIVANKHFQQELAHLQEMQGYDYDKGLEISRNRGVKTLVERDFSREKTSVLVQAVNVLDERLRLSRGQSTANVSLAGIIEEIAKGDNDDTQK